jgi:hypothetical protein
VRRGLGIVACKQRRLGSQITSLVSPQSLHIEGVANPLSPRRRVPRPQLPPPVRLGGKRGYEDSVGMHHLVEARSYLTRMATECIGSEVPSYCLRPLRVASPSSSGASLTDPCRGSASSERGRAPGPTRVTTAETCAQHDASSHVNALRM